MEKKSTLNKTFLKPIAAISLFTWLTLLSVCKTNAQVTIVLQPDSVLGKDACVDSYYPTSPGPGVPELNSQSWTHGGQPEDERGLIDFDLSVIPAGAVIQSAHLTLYNNPTSSNGFQNGEHSHLSATNESVLQRITSPWNEDSVYWNNQPTSTNVNEVVLPIDTNPHQDYISDVTLLIQDMINNPATSFGFMLKLQTETPYRCLLFASSDHPNAALHPKLEITYTITCTNMLTLQPDSVLGKDVCVDSYYPNSPGPGVPELNSSSWTHGGQPEDERGLVDFDLTSIPAGSTIQSAFLTLYNNPTSSNGQQNGQHFYQPGLTTNESVLQRIITPWNEDSVYWNNQPLSTNANEVVLPIDTNPHQNYIANVTLLVQDMINNPATSFGFLLKMVTETPYRCLLFASSDHPNAALHPKLEVCYTTPVGINYHIPLKNDLEIFPNPTEGSFTLQFSKVADSERSLKIYNTLEELIYNDMLSAGSIQQKINWKPGSGIYFIHVTDGARELVKKLIVK